MDHFFVAVEIELINLANQPGNIDIQSVSFLFAAFKTFHFRELAGFGVLIKGRFGLGVSFVAVLFRDFPVSLVLLIICRCCGYIIGFLHLCYFKE